MTASRPAGPAGQEKRVIDIADQNRIVHRLPLEVALKTKCLVAFLEQSLVDRAMRRMASGTTFADCFVFINKRAALRGVTLKANIVLAQKRQPATQDMLSHACAPTFHGAALVDLVTIRTIHLPFQNRVAMRELKLRANVQVTLEARLRRAPRIDDQVRRAAALRMQTSGAVARFASGVGRIRARRLQAGMRRGAEIAHDLLVAIRALVCADKSGARNTWRSCDRAATVECSTGEEGDGENVSAAGGPKQSQAVGVHPLS
jgi:hypothetical protein